MAKKKAATNGEIDMVDLYAEIALETNGDILDNLDSVKYHIDTGSLAFNYVCSGRFIKGGVPGQKITEIYGPSSSGKSLVANNCLFGAQKLGGWAIILDCENSTNKDFMQKASHLDPRKLIRYTPLTLEQAFLKVHNAVKKIREIEKKHKMPRMPIVVVYDSISVSPCERELKETNLPDDYKPTDWKKIVGRHEQPGERAKICSAELRKIGQLLEDYDATMVIINQTREKIGVMYGSPETTAGGGNALPFYASCRVRTQQKKKIENKKFETYAGVNMQVKNIKNKTFKPFLDAEDIKVYFDTGIDPVSGLLTCLLKDGRVNMYSAGRFEVMPDYMPELKAEYKFQASKTNNEMPLDVILDCPKLIDAESREEVEEYLLAFDSAMKSTASGDFTEKKVTFDFDGNPVEVEDVDEEVEED